MPICIKSIDFDKADRLTASEASYLSHRFRHIVAEAIAAERERCAQIAEHLNGWGNKATQQSGLAEHIAKVIRGL